MSASFLEVETLAHCPICGEGKAEAVLTHPDGYIPILHLWRCAVCQSVYLSPRLTLNSIIAVEDESKVHIYTPALREEQITGGQTNLIRWLATYVRTQQRQLLDIGCNRGLLLEAARRQGWQVTGVEISPESANRARNDYHLTVYSTLDELEPQKRFDLITVWHVLEHTLDPVLFIQQAVTRLQPGGILAIQVPSFDFIDELRRRDQLSSVICTVHNFYFTAACLRFILEKAGLSIRYIDNDPNTLFLTIIAEKSLTTLDRLIKARHLIQHGKWRMLQQEMRNYIRWKLSKAQP